MSALFDLTQRVYRGVSPAPPVARLIVFTLTSLAPGWARIAFEGGEGISPGLSSDVYGRPDDWIVGGVRQRRVAARGKAREKEGDIHMEFNLEQIDTLLSTTRAVRRRLDFN